MPKQDERAGLGSRLKEAREYGGFSQEDVAKYLGVSRSAISLMESGQRGVDVMELRKLADLYQTSIEHLTGERTPNANASSITLLARAAASLTPEDRSEVVRFAQFLQARSESKKK